MNLQALVTASAPPVPVAAQVAGLVEAKRRTNERGDATRLPELDALIRDELSRAAEVGAADAAEGAWAEADAVFLDVVG